MKKAQKVQKHRKYEKSEQRKKKFPLPPVGCRILIYIAAIVFSVLALVQVALEPFSALLGIACYVMAAITLAASCYCFIFDIRIVRNSVKGKVLPGIQNNPKAKRIFSDTRYRTFLMMDVSFILNLIFAAFNGVLGILNHSMWAGIMAFYYLILGLMRSRAIQYNRQSTKMQDPHKVLKKGISIYRNCSFLLVLMTLGLAVAVVLLVREQGGKHYPGFTIYAFALYAFVKIILAVKNRIQASRSNSPIRIAIQNIGYIDALVSILMLQTALLETFGGSDMSADMSAVMNGITGGVVCFLTSFTGIFGIFSARKMRRQLREKGE